jgi:putative flippase GtrA
MNGRWRWMQQSLAPHRGRLRFEIIAFVLVGGVQVVLDTLVFIALGALGVPVFAANVAGRVAGASVGFLINGRVTFASTDGHGLDRGALARFVAAWAVLTTLGGVLLVQVEQGFGLTAAWLAKPMVEAFLAVLGFVSLKYFVFARRFR